MHMLYSRYGKQRLEAEMKALFGSSLSTWVLERPAPLRPPARALTLTRPFAAPQRHPHHPVRSDGDGTLTFLDYLKCVNSPHAREGGEREREARPLALVFSPSVPLLAPHPRDLTSACPLTIPPLPLPLPPVSARATSKRAPKKAEKGAPAKK